MLNLRLVFAATLLLGVTIPVVLPGAVHAPARALAEAPVRVMFVGDLMLDRTVAASARESGAASLFATSTRALLGDADLRVANLEGAITTEPSVAQRHNKILRFTFSPALAHEVLSSLRIEAVSLANNHTLDFYDSGYASTRSYLGQWGIASFGHPQNAASTLLSTLTVGGKRLCLVGYNATWGAGYSRVAQEVEHVRSECWRVVVFAHWGVEYEPSANEAQVAAAHALVDAGADLVVGAHPHVVENYEVYKNKAIFYSLGNFMFDQNFSKATQQGVALRADFYGQKTVFTLTPVSVAWQRSSVLPGVASFELP